MDKQADQARDRLAELAKNAIKERDARTAVLAELEASFDEQTYLEKSREDFDAPDDREYSVTITAKQLRAISKALNFRAEGSES